MAPIVPYHSQVGDTHRRLDAAHKREAELRDDLRRCEAEASAKLNAALHESVGKVARLQEELTR
jgi:hypothetical protein